MKKLYTLSLLLLIFACKKDDPELLPLSAEKDILSFVFTVNNTPYSATISGTTIAAELPANTDETTLTPTITLSKGASVNPNSGVAQDFSKDVTYTVTAEDKSTKTYKVALSFQNVTDTQETITIEYIPSEDTTGKAGGEIISFNTNILPFRKEQIKVKLIQYRDPSVSYDLKVQKADRKQKQVDVLLPDTYQNGQYYFLATFGSQEVRSGAFNLDSSTIVLNVLDINNFEGPFTSLAATHLQKFKAVVYANPEALKGYTYYLRKNGQDYQLNADITGNYNIDFSMFDTPSAGFTGGKDFKFVIKDKAKEYELPFVNSGKEPIEIVATKAPVIHSLSKTSLRTDDELVVTGENFSYMTVGRNSDYRSCSLLLMKDGEVKYTIDTYNHQGTTATFKIDEEVASGTYKVVLSSQILLKTQPFAQEITIEKVTPEAPPRLKVNGTAELIDENATYFAKQINIFFNEEIGNASIKAIVFPNLKIENMTKYPKVVSSRRLSDSEYNYLLKNTNFAKVL